MAVISSAGRCWGWTAGLRRGEVRSGPLRLRPLEQGLVYGRARRCKACRWWTAIVLAPALVAAAIVVPAVMAAAIVAPTLMPAVVVVVPIFDVLAAFDYRGATEVDTHADLDGRTWQRRWCHVHRRGRATNQGTGTPARPTDGDFRAHHGGRDLNIDDGTRVRHGRIGFVDHRIARPFIVVGRGEVAHVPVRTARKLELGLRRRLVAVEVWSLDVAVDGVPELDLGFDDRVRPVVRVARTIVVERGRVADEVELPVGLAVHARILRGIVVHVRYLDVAVAAAEFVRHGVLRKELDRFGLSRGKERQ